MPLGLTVPEPLVVAFTVRDIADAAKFWPPTPL